MCRNLFVTQFRRVVQGVLASAPHKAGTPTRSRATTGGKTHVTAAAYSRWSGRIENAVERREACTERSDQLRSSYTAIAQEEFFSDNER
jgi:hypothetical protein